jgi:hypothetical protein
MTVKNFRNACRRVRTSAITCTKANLVQLAKPHGVGHNAAERHPRATRCSWLGCRQEARWQPLRVAVLHNLLSMRHLWCNNEASASKALHVWRELPWRLSHLPVLLLGNEWVRGLPA